MGDNVLVETAPRHEYTASLRIFSTNKSLAELIAILGNPSDGHDVGDAISARHPERTHDASRWGLESTVGRTRRLEEHIDELVTFVENHRDIFTRLQADCEIDIFCGVFTSDNINGGFVLEPSLAGRLHELQLLVVVDIH
jgi:hypothetical protein